MRDIACVLGNKNDQQQLETICIRRIKAVNRKSVISKMFH